MPTPITGQGISAPPKVDATLSNTSKNAVQNKAVANALAGAYDATATYAVGDLCIYDGILYECTTAITTAEAWDATHWKTGNFGEKVSGLNRQLSDVEENQIPELKNAIGQKQNATSYVTLSGTIVTQIGADNTMYLCGELAELTFTAPETGQTAIRFSSGTTPTVATFSGVTWLNGFDPSAIEASKTYEINILYGVGVASWT